MNEPSNFQLQYPLSPKKFWKKILPDLFWYFFVAIIFGGIALAFTVAIANADPSLLKGVRIILVYALIFYTVVILLRSWYIRIYIRKYYYDCNDNFVTIQKGVFSPTEIHVQYQKIQDVYVDQDILDRIMGLYDVHIASATVSSGIAAHIDGVEQNAAEALKNILLARIQRGANSLPSGSSSSSQPSETPTFQFSQKISTETYPINSSWVFTKIMGGFFHALWLTSLGYLVFNKEFAHYFTFASGLGYALLLFSMIFLWRIIWTLLYKHNYYFEFLPDFILLKTGIISKSENHLPYKSIQNVATHQGIIERLFGLATVIIQNAAQSGAVSGRSVSMVSSAIPLVGQPLEKANELNQILNQVVSSIHNPSGSGL